MKTDCEIKKGDLIRNKKTGAIHRVCWFNDCGWYVISEIGESINPKNCEKFIPEPEPKQEVNPEFSLKSYINSFHNGSNRDFARCNGVLDPQVTQWKDKGFIVVNGVLYSPRRELNKPD